MEFLKEPISSVVSDCNLEVLIEYCNAVMKCTGKDKAFFTDLCMSIVEADDLWGTNPQVMSVNKFYSTIKANERLLEVISVAKSYVNVDASVYEPLPSIQLERVLVDAMTLMLINGVKLSVDWFCCEMTEKLTKVTSLRSSHKYLACPHTDISSGGANEEGLTERLKQISTLLKKDVYNSINENDKVSSESFEEYDTLFTHIRNFRAMYEEIKDREPAPLMAGEDFHALNSGNSYIDSIKFPSEVFDKLCQENKDLIQGYFTVEGTKGDMDIIRERVKDCELALYNGMLQTFYELINTLYPRKLGASIAALWLLADDKVTMPIKAGFPARRGYGQLPKADILKIVHDKIMQFVNTGNQYPFNEDSACQMLNAESRILNRYPLSIKEIKERCVRSGN